jgi:amidohydrolase
MATDTRWITHAVDSRWQEMVATRRHLHKHPELSGAEFATAAFIAERLRDYGLRPELFSDGTGVAAVLQGQGDSGRPRRNLLLRADIDALPITEVDDGRRYRSCHDGVMHACGHDAHTAIALGVAGVLSKHRGYFSGSVRFVFQPDEERISGARAMIASGVLDGHNLDGALGLHVLSQLEAGTVGVRDGAVFASCDQFTIELFGRAGHGGLPHRALDPIPSAAAIVLQIQTLITRETSPLDSASISFGTIHGGEATSSIAARVTLTGALRAFDPKLRDRLLARIQQMSVAIAEANGIEAEFAHGPWTPPVVSDPAMAQLVRRAAAQTPGAELREIDALPVADDVAEFLSRIPGCYFMLGAGDRAHGITAPHHHPDFDLAERCMRIGAEVLTRAAVQFCNGEVLPGTTGTAAPGGLLRIDGN